MSSNPPGTLKYASRVYGDKPTGGVEITCSRCHRTEWKPAHSIGHGGPIFKARGWLLGRQGANTDVCPGCRAQKQKRPDMTPAQRKAAYNRIEAEHALKATAGMIRKAGYMGSSVLDPGGFQAEGQKLDIVEPINPIMREKMTQAITEAQHPTEQWPALLPYTGRDGALYHVATSGFSRLDNAKRAALKWLGRQGIHEPKQGVDYVITKRGDAYSWHPPNRLPAEKDATDDARAHKRLAVALAEPSPEPAKVVETSPEPPSKKYRKVRAPVLQGTNLSTAVGARRSAVVLLQRVGVENAQENVHYTIHREPGGTWGHRLLIHIDAVADTPQPATTEDPPPMPDHTAEALQAGVLRQPTREQRQSMRDLLDAQYNTEVQRYRQDWSDRKIAEQLDLPRAWVVAMRLDMYGDYDRNEVSELQVKKMDDAIALATAATSKLIEMASEAEKIANDLKAARSRLL